MSTSAPNSLPMDEPPSCPRLIMPPPARGEAPSPLDVGTGGVAPPYFPFASSSSGWPEAVVPESRAKERSRSAIRAGAGPPGGSAYLRESAVGPALARRATGEDLDALVDAADGVDVKAPCSTASTTSSRSIRF